MYEKYSGIRREKLGEGEDQGLPGASKKLQEAGGYLTQKQVLKKKHNPEEKLRFQGGDQ